VQSRRRPTASPAYDDSLSAQQEGSGSEWSCEDRRDNDRRDQPTSPLSGLFGPLRRAAGRRETDQMGYVDRYTRRDVALILAVFLMNVGDAFFTMLWLNRGGKEANPVMDFFLDIGPTAFLIQKCIVVGIWLVVLLVHKNFRFARIGIYVTFTAYGLLMILHFGIIATGVEPHDPGRLVNEPIILERSVESHAPINQRVDPQALE
jgi:hypothetical protein